MEKHRQGAARAAMDANEAAASIAYRLSEVVALYPITPASPMGEHADQWATEGQPNLFAEVPAVVEMQSEVGAAGMIHGALVAGSLATTFTSSQGLLLMIPNMYKIAGELLPFCLHVAARAVATHALSIFGDHSDVMACRQTGFAMLCSTNAQEAHDLALVAHAATLSSRVPFLHFFDGFRTSHEVTLVEELSDADLLSLVDRAAIDAHRARALTPDRPSLRGTAQNPDVFFQGREAQNTFYDRAADLVEAAMHALEARSGRAYRPFELFGDPEAERVVVVMGSAFGAAREAVCRMNARGERVAALNVRLYRPFSMDRFLAALPKTTRAITVLDRTKEPGATGEPLFLDVVAALEHGAQRGALCGPRPRVVGGRYGLASKELTPSMIKAALEELSGEAPKARFTLGIVDDVTGLSLPHDPSFDAEDDDVFRAVCFGLGSDGTVSSNKAALKIIASETPSFVQGHFVYDSKKSGSVTVSHLRVGPRPITSTWLVQSANLVTVNDPGLVERIDCFSCLAEGATVLVNTPLPPERAFAALPRTAQELLVERRCRLFVVDAFGVAARAGLGRKIGVILQACFFGLARLLPIDRALACVTKAAAESYGKRGDDVVKRNQEAAEAALSHVFEASLGLPGGGRSRRAALHGAGAFVHEVTMPIFHGDGDRLPVSAVPLDGTFPTATSRWEKRGIALEAPVWEPSLCIQCNKCVLACPHAAIRANVVDRGALAGAPPSFQSMDARFFPEFEGGAYTLAVSPDDCTGCGVCVEVCPGIDKADRSRVALRMASIESHGDAARTSLTFFGGLPHKERAAVKLDVKGSQLLRPLFEYSGACSGCGETPYLKLLTQLVGDRLVVANATGCSSIYGGNLPTTPWCVDEHGRGPAWANSLFEDNAEFGLGLLEGTAARARRAQRLVRSLAPVVGDELAAAILVADMSDEAGIAAQRERVAALLERLQQDRSEDARELVEVADALIVKSVWLVGGDGWAYDIGYGGLDHVLASGARIKALVLDTEVYSNTGGQCSKATPRGAVARFAAGGKESKKKDIGLLAMTYGHVYVAQIALHVKTPHTLRALQEAESYDGPALVIAHSPCIAHGYDLRVSPEHQKLAVEAGAWPLYRYDPRRAERDENPLVLESGKPKRSMAEYMGSEERFRQVERKDAARYARLVEEAQRDADQRFATFSARAAPRARVAVAASEPGKAG